MDNIKLIKLVKVRRDLWDSNMRMCDRKPYLITQWKEVAREMNFDVEFTKKRWKCLRDSYRTEIRKLQKGQITKSKWAFFHGMEFLRDIFDANKLVPFPAEEREIILNDKSMNDRTLLDDLKYENININDDDSFGFDVIDEDIFHQKALRSSNIALEPPIEQKCTTNEKSYIGTPNHNSDLTSIDYNDIISKLTNSTHCSTPTRVDNKSGFIEESLSTTQHTTTNIVNVTKESNKEDSDYSFLISMLPHMKSLSDMGNLRFRMEVSKLLMDIRHSEMGVPDNSNGEVDENMSSPLRNSGFRNLNTTDHNSNGYQMRSLTPAEFLDCEIKVENEPIVIL